MGLALSIVGTIFQGLGAAIVGIGVWKTWHEFAQGERFIDPFVARARFVFRRLPRWTQRLLRKILGRGGSITVQVPSISMSMSGSARTRISPMPLPRDVEGALRELDRRTRETSKTLADTADRIDNSVRIVNNRTNEIARKLDMTAAQLEMRTRHVAIGGVRYETFGVLLIVIGLFFQGVGLAIGTPPPPPTVGT